MDSLVKVYTINGRVVSNKTIDNDIQTMDISDLAKGLCHIKLADYKRYLLLKLLSNKLSKITN